MFKFIHEKRKAKRWNQCENVTIVISLHNQNHYGEKFKKIVDWVNEQSNFKRCYVDLADTLNRHNYMLYDSIDELSAHKKARHFGDLWLERNGRYLEELIIPYSVNRWDRWIKHPKYPDVLSKYEKSYNTNELFKQAVDDLVKSFFSRRGINISHILPKEFRHSVNFVLEELSGDTVIYEEMKSAYVYPARELDVYKMVRHGCVPNVPSGLENSYHVWLMGKEYIPDVGIVDLPQQQSTALHQQAAAA